MISPCLSSPEWKAVPFSQKQLLAWAQQFETFTYLNPNGIAYPSEPFAHLLAVGAKKVFEPRTDTFEQLRLAQQQCGGWLFGYLSYDLKNELEALSSTNPDRVGLPNARFYQPEYLFKFEGENVWSWQVGADALSELLESAPLPTKEAASHPITILRRTSRERYLEEVEAVRQHILKGEVYELNYCQEFYAESAQIDPWETYLRLCEASPMPFSCFQRMGSHYAICASPERFMKKTGSKLISQPIKGTIRRGKSAAEDAALKKELFQSEKERAENIMIVDLVRNDLARTAQTGTVQVEELLGIYTFQQLHQMISTVASQLLPELSFADALRHAFPMGSMTGAPKIRSMELIEQYERVKRGLYSGAIGYLTPAQDFDFNVVIRTILYHAENQYLSFQVGGAITFDSNPEQEYEECLLKAQAIHRVLGAS